MNTWDVLPDNERRQWVLDPFVSVGPLRFGMSRSEVSAELGGIQVNWGVRSAHDGAGHDSYSEVGLTLHYAAGDQLRAVRVDALGGPQVFAGDTALVGRVPSELERWVEVRAERREPDPELFYLPGGEIGSVSLGLALCLQRAGDRLLTRPVFLSSDTMEDSYDKLGRDAWVIS
ncbi:hypothetical protein [Streptomyces cadmiisoli]|uniref:hypothetical protein n=1 Tax=Streptomyces cadmiisoli TaxID=2184053 RepID=UPI0013A6BE30|nr:hypothetical protein [Streptomyces cadmiisoli]